MFLINIILFYLLLLYECSGNIYSTNFLSNTFLSNTFLSNTFLSSTFLSNTFLSNTFLSNAFLSNTFLSSTFLSNTFQSTKMISTTYKHSLYMLTLVPSSYLYIKSSNMIYSNSISVNKLSFTLSPTLVPTSTVILSNTFAPTLESLLSFTTDLTLSNVQSSHLDSVAQESIIIAQALTMNISSDFITFVSSSIYTDIKMNKIKTLSFTLLVTTKTNIILKGKYSVFLNNQQALFTTLSTTMTNAVTSGTFTQNLATMSLHLNSSTTSSASVASISISNPSTFTSNTATLIPTLSATLTPTLSATLIPTLSATIAPSNTLGTNTKNYYNSFLVIFVSLISVSLFFCFVIMLYFFYKKRNRIFKKMLLRQPRIRQPRIRQLDGPSDVQSEPLILNTNRIELNFVI